MDELSLITLAAAKSYTDEHGGGGGGGTSNYNDLSNKPQIGGVTLQGDKSLWDLGIKNEFIGTTAEWNALTAEQKKAYDTYQITDDYTEGSGGLPDYSTTEQLTGQKWIDGKDIYFKTLELTVPSDVSAGITRFSGGIADLASVRAAKISSATNVCGYIPWYAASSVMFSDATTTDIGIYFGGNHYAGQKIYVTLYYTKNA